MKKQELALAIIRENRNSFSGCCLFVRLTTALAFSHPNVSMAFLKQITESLELVTSCGDIMIKSKISLRYYFVVLKVTAAHTLKPLISWWYLVEQQVKTW